MFAPQQPFLMKTCITIMSLFSIASVRAEPDYAKVISGWVETVVISDSSVVTKAKLDTGARTSSINADRIELFEKEGQTWVRFELVLESLDNREVRILQERPRIRGVKIKDHDGSRDKRVVVDLDICFDGREYKPEFTLANRSEYIYDVLLGRAFLSGVAVVDSEETFQTMGRCPES